MKGLTATQLITALAVGILIIGILAWLVITWTGKGSGQISQEACKAKALSLCGQWALCDYSEEPGSCMPSEDRQLEFDLDCGEYFSFGKDLCQSIMP